MKWYQTTMEKKRAFIYNSMLISTFDLLFFAKSIYYLYITKKLVWNKMKMSLVFDSALFLVMYPRK